MTVIRRHNNSLDYSIKMALSPSCAPESFMELLKCVHARGLTSEAVMKARVENHRSRERTEGKNWATGNSQGEFGNGDGMTFYRSRRKVRKIKYGRIQRKRKFPERIGGKNSTNCCIRGQEWCLESGAWLLGSAKWTHREWMSAEKMPPPLGVQTHHSIAVLSWASNILRQKVFTGLSWIDYTKTWGFTFPLSRLYFEHDQNLALRQRKIWQLSKQKKRFNHSFIHSVYQSASQPDIYIHPFFKSHLLQGMKIALQNLIFKPHDLH